MKILSPKSASKIRSISSFCAVPERAYMRMLRCIKAAEVYMGKIVIRNMYNKLIMLRVGTNEVVATAKRVVGGDNDRQLESEVIRIMKIRRKNVEREIKDSRYEWHKAKSSLTPDVNNRAKKKYWKVEKDHKQYVWEQKVASSKKKVQSLRTKRNQSTERVTQRRAEVNPGDTGSMRANNRFYLVTDEELKVEGQEPEYLNYEVYGNVVLSKQEKDCLSLGPKYMVTPRLIKEDFQVELEVECVKTRIEISSREEVEDETGDVEDEDMEMMRAIDRETREIFDREKGELNMSKLRVTDAKYNTRSFPPRETNTEDETLLQARRQAVMEDYDEYVRENTNKKGEVKNINMTEDQIEGMKSLNKRWKEGEIIITTTDKSGKYAVVETSLYKEQARIHIQDEEINMKEVEEIEILMNRHTQQLVKALEMGTKHGKFGQKGRIRKAFRSKGGQPGPVQFMVKDHKQLEEGKNMQPTRLVCSAKGGVSSRASNLGSTMLNKAADAMKSETECLSTEEMKKEILETNRRITEKCQSDPEYKRRIQKAEIFSLDVKALYPSLKVAEVKKIVMEKLERVQGEEKLKVKDVDFHEVGKYLAIACSEDEIRDQGLKEVMPIKTASNRGPKPGPAYWETDHREVCENGEKKQVEKWIKGREPEEKEQHKMISLMLAKLVEVVMTNHTYRFDGKVYKQVDGGPIGDEMSQAVARIVMIWFDERFTQKCEERGIEVVLYKRYVDDVNMMVIPPENMDGEPENGENTN